MPLDLGPVASRRILACRDTWVAALLERRGGMHPEPDAPETRGLPAGVTGWVTTAPPAIAAPLRARDLDAVHDAALCGAWADGAWDLACSFHPPLAGPDLGLVTAFVDYEDPGLRDILVEAAGRGRLATWLWLPMRGAPGRLRVHGAKDASLDAAGGRAGPPPPGLARPDPAWRDGRTWTIRLGTWSPEHAPKRRPPYSPPATKRQRACIAALQYAAGATRPDIPARLSMRAASAMIDELKATGGGDV